MSRIAEFIYETGDGSDVEAVAYSDGSCWLSIYTLGSYSSASMDAREARKIATSILTLVAESEAKVAVANE